MREMGGCTVIAESSAIDVDMEESFRVCGYDGLRSEGYEVVDLKRANLVTVPVPKGDALKELKLPEMVL
ncbi:DUF362 domain-containing protein [Chloroflexota bacterium]